MEFKNLAEVELLGEVPEGASVLAATADGNVVRVPGDGLGGGAGGGVVTAIIKSSEYDNAVAGVSAAIAAGPSVTYSANMTFGDAMAAAASGCLDIVIASTKSSGTPVIYHDANVEIYLDSAEIVLISYSFANDNGGVVLIWNADGVFAAA